MFVHAHHDHRQVPGQNAAGGGNSRMMNFGKSRAVMTTKEQNSVTFQEVAGLQEEKEELEEIVDFLRNPTISTSN